MSSDQERLDEQKRLEERVRDCYRGWSGSYYDEYYGEKAAYPPVHRELLKQLLAKAGSRTILDAGCGPASFLREIPEAGAGRYGFDMTPQMVEEARRVLAGQGVPPQQIWEGSVLAAESYRVPERTDVRFDAAICVGVLPHVPPGAERGVIRRLREAVVRGGLVVIEARNQLFSLFTLNRPSWEFFRQELLPVDALSQAGGDAEGLARALDEIQEHFRMDLPPVRTGREGVPGYDEVLSRVHNPLLLREQFAAEGFVDVQLLFYHFHCLPPLAAHHLPDTFRRHSLAMENPTDWRGYFMASAFLLAGRRD